MRLILLGPPGAGKGTLASLIKSTLGIAHISTGDILREEIKKGSEVGKEAKSHIESGGLVPDEVVTKIIENRLATGEGLDKGFMLDGYPRTTQQADDLDAILQKLNQGIDFALYMDASVPVILQRLTGRRVCRKCGALYHVTNMPSKQEGVCDACSGELYQRADDNEETITKRLDVYRKSTEPIIEYYKKQNKLQTIDADKNTEEIKAILLKILDEYKTADTNKDE